MTGAEVLVAAQEDAEDHPVSFLKNNSLGQSRINFFLDRAQWVTADIHGNRSARVMAAILLGTEQ